MFQLPPDISQKKIQIPEGWAYVFRHTDLGELGRILLTTHTDGRTIISASTTGHEDDPMTTKRHSIFKPLGNKLIKAYEDVMAARGHKHSEPIDPPVVRVTKQIATKMLQCNTCGKNVGLLIFAHEGNEVAFLEDAARLMYQKIQDFRVPTWIIGEISGLGNPMKNKAKILHVYPYRMPVFEASPEEFDSIIDALEAGHCK